MMGTETGLGDLGGGSGSKKKTGLYWRPPGSPNYSSLRYQNQGSGNFGPTPIDLMNGETDWINQPGFVSPLSQYSKSRMPKIHIPGSLADGYGYMRGQRGGGGGGGGGGDGGGGDEDFSEYDEFRPEGMDDDEWGNILGLWQHFQNRPGKNRLNLSFSEWWKRYQERIASGWKPPNRKKKDDGGGGDEEDEGGSSKVGNQTLPMYSQYLARTRYG